VASVWVLEVDPLAPSIYVFLNPICICESLSLCDKKCRLFFICLWIALFETHLTLLCDIFFAFPFMVSCPPCLW
jgi:hypothetical protein